MPRRIVADNGEYMLQNKGDLALLTVTVQRLLERWPDACVGVLTFEPRMLRAYAPRAEPLAFGRGGRWPESDWFDSVAKRAGPALVSPTIGMRSRVSALMRQPSRLIRHAAPAAGEEQSSDHVVEPDYAAQPVPAAIEDADLVVAIGGGYMADVDRAQAHRTLNLLERAADRGVPTAMLGQGLGPLEDPRLTARASAVLPRVDVIAVREARVGPSLLERWGVAPDRVVVTGDDAIELAHRAAPIRLGRGIGVCLRTTGYAPVAGHAREELRDALHASGRDLGAALVPFAISEYEAEDRRATLPLVAGYPDVSSAAQPLRERGRRGTTGRDVSRHCHRRISPRRVRPVRRHSGCDAERVTLLGGQDAGTGRAVRVRTDGRRT